MLHFTCILCVIQQSHLLRAEVYAKSPRSVTPIRTQTLLLLQQTVFRNLAPFCTVATEGPSRMGVPWLLPFRDARFRPHAHIWRLPKCSNHLNSTQKPTATCIWGSWDFLPQFSLGTRCFFAVEFLVGLLWWDLSLTQDHYRPSWANCGVWGMG